MRGKLENLQAVLTVFLRAYNRFGAQKSRYLSRRSAAVARGQRLHPAGVQPRGQDEPQPLFAERDRRETPRLERNPLEVRLGRCTTLPAPVTLFSPMVTPMQKDTAAANPDIILYLDGACIGSAIEKPASLEKKAAGFFVQYKLRRGCRNYTGWKGAAFPAAPGEPALRYPSSSW